VDKSLPGGGLENGRGGCSYTHQIIYQSSPSPPLGVSLHHNCYGYPYRPLFLSEYFNNKKNIIRVSVDRFKKKCIINHTLMYQKPYIGRNVMKCKRCEVILDHKNRIPKSICTFLSSLVGSKKFSFKDYCNDCIVILLSGGQE